MCGIAGVLKKQDTEAVGRMLEKIHHRGPDGRGIKNLVNGTLGHTRLAIIDVEGGRQPMGFDDTWVTFNGEIYNFRELAVEHLSDVALKTRSDTEVLVRMYQKMGPRCVEYLRGMFAFAIIQGDEYFLARDPLGIKPLYCCETNEDFYFASEIKALSEVCDNIREFPAGYWFHSKEGWHSFYELETQTTNFSDENAAIHKIHETLEDAVRLRMIADVPVGISLSGGLDSSIISLLASRETEQLHSFAVGMEGSEDLAAAQKMAKLLHTRHHERVYTEPEMLNILPKVIYHLESFDPALVRSAIPNYFLAEMASKTVKVILTGEGADELFAGYDYMHTYNEPERLQKEMCNITSALHNTNLQRADRISMAFSLEARVPFLDTESVALGLSLPAEWKAHQDRPPKHLLREAFKNDLPEEIINRPKQKFSQGAGSSDVISRIVDAQITNAELESERARLLYDWNYRLQNREALYYYRILSRFFNDQWIFPTIGVSRSL